MDTFFGLYISTSSYKAIILQLANLSLTCLFCGHKTYLHQLITCGKKSYKEMVSSVVKGRMCISSSKDARCPLEVNKKNLSGFQSGPG